jgi:adenosylcobinamide-GDP ribazoletransferase
MGEYAENMQNLITDLRIGISLCTRLPIASTAPLAEGDVARASWTLPIAGLFVGLVGSLIYWLAIRINVAPLPAAALTLAATMALTGAMHEDGLADTADGLGGNARERKLEIMRDSRIGTFGACALLVSAMLRWSAIADIAEPSFVTTALIAAHVAARACLPVFMRLVPPARSDGLASGAGSPPWASAGAAAVLGIICLLFSFGVMGTIITVLILAVTGLSLARVAIKQFGGQTGDVLGAVEQVSESAILLAAASFF